VTVTSGAGTWTNTMNYAGVTLTRVFVHKYTALTDTCTVTRVTSGTVSTQTVGTVTVAARVGNTGTFTASQLLNGDKLVFAFGKSSNGVAVVDYTVQKH